MPAYVYPQSFCNTTGTTSNYYVPTWTSNTGIATTQVVWQNWNATTITQPAVQWIGTTHDIWQGWVTNATTINGTYSYQQRRETPEERAQRERREVERVRERQAARTRARVLLEEFLDEEQKVELERQGRFHVTGSKGRRYCIRTTGQAGNVDLLKPDGGVQATLCCHPRGALPDGDAWLMQMVEIRHNEEHFLATANVHRGHVPVG